MTVLLEMKHFIITLALQHNPETVWKQNPSLQSLAASLKAVPLENQGTLIRLLPTLLLEPQFNPWPLLMSLVWNAGLFLQDSSWCHDTTHKFLQNKRRLSFVTSLQRKKNNNFIGIIVNYSYYTNKNYFSLIQFNYKLGIKMILKNRLCSFKWGYWKIFF